VNGKVEKLCLAQGGEDFKGPEVWEGRGDEDKKIKEERKFLTEPKVLKQR